jgi:hypothetical protein
MTELREYKGMGRLDKSDQSTSYACLEHSNGVPQVTLAGVPRARPGMSDLTEKQSCWSASGHSNGGAYPTPWEYFSGTPK